VRVNNSNSETMTSVTDCVPLLSKVTLVPRIVYSSNPGSQKYIRPTSTDAVYDRCAVCVSDVVMRA